MYDAYNANKGTGSDQTFGENAPQNPNAPPAYQDPNAPPTYQDVANGPPAYQNPAGYAPPPSFGGGDMGYTAPPVNNQPSYAGPPVSNAQPSYTGPPMSNAQPSYTGPPVSNTQPSYSNPGPTYAQPPSGNPYVGNSGIAPVAARSAVRAPKFQLFGCFENCKYCLWVWCCYSCALGEIRTALSANSFDFWCCVLALGGIQALWTIAMFSPAMYNLIFWAYVIWNGIATFFLMEATKNIYRKLGIQQEDVCVSCLLSFCCGGCRLCQLGNELTQIEIPEVRELVINIQKASPCGQACMNDVRVSAQDNSGIA